MKSLTIVVPVYNDTESLARLKDEITITDTQDFQWMIVDNGSTDERLIDFLSDPYNPWETVRCEENLGFGGGYPFWNITCKNGVCWLDARKS